MSSENKNVRLPFFGIPKKPTFSTCLPSFAVNHKISLGAAVPPLPVGFTR